MQNTAERTSPEADRRHVIMVGPCVTPEARYIGGQRGVVRWVCDISERARTDRRVGRVSVWRCVDYIRTLTRLWICLLWIRMSRLMQKTFGRLRPLTGQPRGSRSAPSDLVYLTTAQSLAGFCRDAGVIWPARLLGYRIMAHQFGANYGQFYDQQSRLKKWMIRTTLNRVDCVVVEGEYVKSQFSMLKNHDSRVATVPNGLPVLDLPRWSPRSWSAERPFQLLYLSNMVETKGYWDVLEACRLLHNDRGRHVRCRFIGDWLPSSDSVRFKSVEQARHAFEEFCREHHLEDVVSHDTRLLGDAKEAAFGQSDVFLLPSNFVNEGQPVSVLEAMARGLVVIATQHRLIPTMVREPENGYFVPYAAPDRIADRIEYLMDHPGEFARMSANSIEIYSREFTPESFVNRMEQLLQGVARSGHRGQTPETTSSSSPVSAGAGV